MPLYPSDLAFMSPDSDGTVKLNRGITAQSVVPFPGIPGEIKFYRGKAADVGVGNLLGWKLVSGVSAGTLLRIATADAEVGVTSGSNTLSPSGTVNLLHNHTGITDTQDNTDASKSRNVSQTTSQTTVSHLDHAHTVFPDLANATLVTMPQITISPQAIAFWMIEFVGVSS